MCDTFQGSKAVMKASGKIIKVSSKKPGHCMITLFVIYLFVGSVYVHVADVVV